MSSPHKSLSGTPCFWDGHSRVARLVCAGGTQYQRLSGSLLEGTDREYEMPWTFHPVRYFWWLMSWMIPGGGMFLEAYFIFRCVTLLLVLPFRSALN